MCPTEVMCVPHGQPHVHVICMGPALKLVPPNHGHRRCCNNRPVDSRNTNIPNPFLIMYPQGRRSHSNVIIRNWTPKKKLYRLQSFSWVAHGSLLPVPLSSLAPIPTPVHRPSMGCQLPLHIAPDLTSHPLVRVVEGQSPSPLPINISASNPCLSCAMETFSAIPLLPMRYA